MTHQYRSPSAKKVIQVAKGEIGYHEGKSNGHWNNIQKYSKELPSLNWSNGQAWCATFVSWVATKAGVEKLFPITASTDTAASWYQKAGRWSEYPAVGSQGFLAKGTDEYHTFIVTDFDATRIWTIEGNTNVNGSAEGDGVYRRVRNRADKDVEGYGYPKYPEGIVSADPSWVHQNPKAPQTPKPTPNIDAAIDALNKAVKAHKEPEKSDLEDLVYQLKAYSTKY